MGVEYTGLVVWDVDGTLIPADLRWLRRAVARTYAIQEADAVFPAARVHGYTDETIVVDTAISSGVSPELAERGIERFHEELAQVMAEGEQEFVRDQPAYPGAAEAIAALDERGFVQTVLTGNLRVAAEFKLRFAGLDSHLDLNVGGFGSDARERFELPSVVAERFAMRYGTRLDASRTVVIGDAPNDIACARHAGFHVIAVAHRIDRNELAQHSPGTILERLDSNIVVSAIESLIKRNVVRATCRIRDYPTGESVELPLVPPSGIREITCQEYERSRRSSKTITASTIFTSTPRIASFILSTIAMASVADAPSEFA